MTARRLVVASDLTEATDPVLRNAFELAADLGAAVTVTYVVTDQRLHDLRESLPPDSAYTDMIADRLESDLADQVERVGSPSGVDVDLAVHPGREADEIHRIASEVGAEMIVIGIRNRSRVGKLILGSTAQEVLLGAPCPVLGVPV